MNSIEIIRSNHNDLRTVGQILWKQSAKSLLTLYYVVFFLGVAFVLISLLITGRNESLWGFGTSFGLALIFSSGFLISSHMHSKKNYFIQVEDQITKLHGGKEITKLIFNESGVQLINANANYELKWPYFNRHSLINDFLFLYSSGDNTPAVFINRSEITDEEFTELEIFLEKTLKQK